MGRTVVAVIAGFILWSVLWLVLGFVLHAAFPGDFEPGKPIGNPVILVVSLGWSVVCSIAGGFACAAIGRKQAGTIVLAILLLAVGVAVQAESWDLFPIWFHLSFLALLIPATVGGGALRRTTR